MWAALVATACASAPRGERPVETWAFTAPWDPRSAASVRRFGAQLDAIVTGWVALDSVTGLPTEIYPDSLRATLAPGTRPMLHVTSWLHDRWRTDVVRSLGGDEARLARTASALAAYSDGRYDGLVLDFESHPREDLPLLERVVRAIADSAHGRGVRTVAVAVPAPDTLAYPAAPLLRAADLLLVMLYDEHWIGSGPGPVASPDWVQRWLGARVAEAGAARVIAGLPLYGYRWRAGAPAVDVGYADARRLTDSLRVPLRRDRRSHTLTATAPGLWELWVPDAALVDSLLRIARDAGVERVAFWRLGVEDPALWRGSLRR